MSQPLRKQGAAAEPACHCTSCDHGPDRQGESDVTPGDLSDALKRAMQRLGVQVKEIAYWWKTDHGYVSRVLANKDSLPDHRIKQLPRELRLATLEEWAADEGVVTARKADIGRALQSLARIVIDDERLDVHVRMAKCALKDTV